MLRNTIVLSLMVIVGFSYGCGKDASMITDTGSIDESDSPAAQGHGGVLGQGTVLRLLGDAEGYPATVPDIDGDGIDDPATCFEVDILDAAGRKIGTATDCLSNITGVGDGMSLVGTTTFHLPNGTFVSRGATTVQPVTTSDPTPATHTTGAIPMEGENGIIDGIGAYDGFRAQVRLSGAVNLSRLDSEGRIAFDCLFGITPLR